MADRQSTHGHDCWSWGPKHYECAVGQVERLAAEVERLKSMTAVTMGVGSGNGSLFVHGDYESIKAAQALVFRAERLEKALRLAEEHINALTPEWYSAGQRVLAEIRAALEQEEGK